MWCTLCRAPILADASKGSNVKLQALTRLTTNDIAHLSSAHGFSYAHEAVALEYVPFNEELGLLAQGEKHDSMMTVYTQKLGPENDNWLLHTACLEILLLELDLAEENTTTRDQRALFQHRSDIRRHGELVGMRDAQNENLRYAVSSKNKPLMKRLDWADAETDPWKFTDPNSNEQNRDRIIQTAKLLQRVRLAAGEASPEVTDRVLQIRVMTAKVNSLSFLPSPPGPRVLRPKPVLVQPFGEYAAIVNEGGKEVEGWDIAMAKLYPPIEQPGENYSAVEPPSFDLSSAILA